MGRATIKTIAQEAGVSVATVSKALNDMPDISETMKTRIRKIAQKQGYIINAAAKQLVSGHSHTVGVILADLANIHSALLYKTLSQKLYRAGYSTFCACSEGDLKAEAVLARDMAEHGAGVVLVEAATSEMGHIAQAVEHRAPVVYLGGALNPNAEYAVACDEYAGGMLAARALYDGGCRNVAVITWGAAATAQHQRVRGFVACYYEQGAKLTTHQVPGGLSEQAGRRTAQQILSGERPDGIFCTDDLLALGVLHVLREKNVHVPRDIQLMGYGDFPCAALESAQISTVSLPYGDIGICAADLAANLAAGNGDAVRKLSLSPRLVCRGTTRFRE